MYEFFLSKCAEIRLLSNFADAQGLDSARDHLRTAESQIRERYEFLKEQHELVEQKKLLNGLDQFNKLLPGGKNGGEDEAQGRAGQDQQALGTTGAGLS